MPQSKDGRTNNYSIYLLKEDRKTSDEILKPYSYNESPVRIGTTEIGQLFVRSTSAKLPGWAKLFDGYVDKSKFGKVSTSSAVLLVCRGNRCYAVTFGQGRYFLKPDSWEEKFGLRVALNSVNEKKIRSIDKLTFDSISKQSREQASREGTAQDFGVDIEQDLLRAVTGTPTDSKLGQRLSGMDSLKVAIRAELEDLPALLDRFYKKYQDDTYKENFPWVDHLMEVSDQQVRNQLDDALLKMISNEEFDTLWLAPPEILDWDKVEGFRYGLAKKHPMYHDVHISEFLKSLEEGTEVDMFTLTRKHVHCMGWDRELHQWPVYKCICCEMDLDANSYILNGGKWYRVNKSFVKEINEAYSKIPKFEINLPEYNNATEAEYNENTQKTTPEFFALMDKRLIQYGGGHNKIEFCDLYTRNRSLIHVKRYGGSSSLSHLFSQGVVSAELFQTDVEFRKKVNKLLPSGYKLEHVKEAPKREEFQVVFAIISSSKGDDLVLPFFSRINIRHTVRRLGGYGYRVAIAKIKVDEVQKLKKVYK